jgi:hypothetical protein
MALSLTARCGAERTGSHAAGRGTQCFAQYVRDRRRPIAFATAPVDTARGGGTPLVQIKVSDSKSLSKKTGI